MPLQSATFDTNSVTLFLNRKYPYAATCFAQDSLKHGDRIPSTAVEKWFKSYFPSPLNATEYRNLEANVSQAITFENC